MPSCSQGCDNGGGWEGVPPPQLLPCPGYDVFYIFNTSTSHDILHLCTTYTSISRNVLHLFTASMPCWLWCISPLHLYIHVPWHPLTLHHPSIHERVVKAVVLGWYEKLEGESKMPGRKKKWEVRPLNRVLQTLATVSSSFSSSSSPPPLLPLTPSWSWLTKAKFHTRAILKRHMCVRPSVRLSVHPLMRFIKGEN